MIYYLVKAIRVCIWGFAFLGKGSTSKFMVPHFSVTDSGANWLLHCRKLRVLDLYQTEVNVPVYASLLMGLSELTAVGRRDRFGQVLGK